MTKENDGVWVLTEEYNDYDQHGAYFLAVFQTKPSIKELADWFSVHEGMGFPNIMAGISFLEHLLKGGGRREYEDNWYNLEFVEFAKGKN